MWQLWDMGRMECVCENLEGNYLQIWNLSSQSPAASSLYRKISLIWGTLEIWPQCSVAGNCLENASGLKIVGLQSPRKWVSGQVCSNVPS